MKGGCYEFKLINNYLDFYFFNDLAFLVSLFIDSRVVGPSLYVLDLVSAGLYNAGLP